MAFINQAVTVLQTLVIALGAGLAVWGVVTVSYTHLYPHPAFQTGGFPLQTGQSH